MSRRRPGPGDRGETLIEVLISVVILGLAATAFVPGMAATVKISDIQRKEATAAAYVRNYAETIQNTVAAGGYKPGTLAYPAFTPPNNYTATMATKECWTTGSVWAACTAGNDIGVQRLTLTVSSPDSRATETLAVIVRQPCGTGSGCTS
jgi:prepilin-type N-terminal cleavage/methylation domain-containing protein